MQGKKYIAGVDEVGRGPIAGPLVVCAVILDLHKINDISQEDMSFYSEIKDSKILNPAKRSYLSERLLDEVISYSIIEIANTQIDKQGISKATQTAFYNSVMQLKVRPDHILTDMFKILALPTTNQTNIKRGDSLSMTIAAASILAKVYRDNLMRHLDLEYPNYGFAQHKGYGTKKHIDAVSKKGPCAIHRMSFEPLKSRYK